MELYFYSLNTPLWRGAQSTGTTLPLPLYNFHTTIKNNKIFIFNVLLLIFISYIYRILILVNLLVQFFMLLY
jgi:hypothetical protein